MLKDDFKIKILFVLPSLKAGGAERVISFIASNLDKQKFNSQLLVVGYKKDTIYETNGIEVCYLNKKRVLNAIPSLFWYIFKNKPHIVVGSISHVNQVLAMFSFLFRKVKFIGREAGVSSVMETYHETNRKINIPSFKNYYKYLDAVICQSKDMYEDLKINYNVNNKNCVIINNPITNNFKLKQLSVKNNIRQYITVGTLHKRKGHERLLRLLSKVHHDFYYTIVGNGEELNNLKHLIAELNLVNSVTHIPYTKNVSDYLSNSDVFLNGSYVEGFPNVILESCAVGTPVIAFDAPGGINEIIVKGVNGYIFNCEDSFINMLNNLAKKDTFQPNLVSESVTSRYNKEIILDEYEKLFIKISTSVKL